MADAVANSLRTRSLAMARGAYAWLQSNPLLWSGGLFLAALAVYIAFQAQASAHMGLWYDELFSLWAGDPRLSFGEAFATRILPDTNGPIYFSLVYLAQSAGLADRAAFLVLNITVIGGLLALVLVRGWRYGILATALSSVALLLATAPLLIYGAEGRVYGMAMALCAVVAFEAGRLLAGGHANRNDLILVATLGALAAWMHVFGSIFVGSLGAALIVSGAFVLRRRDIVVWGLVAGAATTVAFVVWIVFAFPLFTGTTSWIAFNKDWVFNAIWSLKNLLVGPTIGVALAFGFIALSLIPRHSRAIALTLAIAVFLLVAIPLAVSFKMPIFLDRYLLVGFPGLFVLYIFLLRAHLVSNDAPLLWRQGLFGLGALFLVLPITKGLPTAQASMESRHEWVGSQLVLQAASKCPEGEIRAATFTPFAFGFDYFLQGKLTAIAPSSAPVRDVSAIDCPVLAWAEHMRVVWTIPPTVDQVLGEFRLTNTTGVPLVLLLHPGGGVLARADANLN